MRCCVALPICGAVSLVTVPFPFPLWCVGNHCFCGVPFSPWTSLASDVRWTMHAAVHLLPLAVGHDLLRSTLKLCIVCTFACTLRVIGVCVCTRACAVTCAGQYMHVASFDLSLTVLVRTCMCGCVCWCVRVCARLRVSTLVVACAPQPVVCVLGLWVRCTACMFCCCVVAFLVAARSTTITNDQRSHLREILPS